MRFGRAVSKRVKPRGFTLIELMVVVAVIAVLAAIMTPFLSEYLRRNRLHRAVAEFRNILIWARATSGGLPYCLAAEINRGGNTPGSAGYITVWAPVLNTAIVPMRDRQCARYTQWANVAGKGRKLAEFSLATMSQGDFLAVQMTDARITPGLPQLPQPFYLLFDSTGMYLDVGGGRLEPSQVWFKFQLLDPSGNLLPNPRELFLSPTGAVRLTGQGGVT